MRKYSFTPTLLILACIFSANECAGQTQIKTYSDEYINKIASTKIVSVLGDDLFGDQINSYSGTVNFSVTDVSIPGNSLLPVSLARKYEAKNRSSNSASSPFPIEFKGIFGDWDWDIPHLAGVYADMSAMTASVPNRRCAASSLADAIPNSNNTLFRPEYDANTNELVLPGQGNQQLLYLVGSSKPTDGNDYRWVTKKRWYFSCLSSTANGVSGDAFLARSPDGTKYWFNQIVQRQAEWTKHQYVAYNNYDPITNQYTDLVITKSIKRYDVRAFPTRIEDRFGNYVNYSYDVLDPWKLLKISSSDGRTISLTYNGYGRVVSASDGTNVWSYAYDSSGYTGSLNKVTLPDSRNWVYNFIQLNDYKTVTNNPYSGSCNGPGSLYLGLRIATITHPSGALGEFTFKNHWHGRSNVTKSCINAVANGQIIDVISDYPAFFSALSLISKKISGPALLSTKQWALTYPALEFSYSDTCPSTNCKATKTISLTQPDGSIKSHTYGVVFGKDDGLLLKTQISSSLANVLSTTVNNYVTNP